MILYILLLLLSLKHLYSAHEERSAVQKMKQKKEKAKQKLWKQMSFQLPLENSQRL